MPKNFTLCSDSAGMLDRLPLERMQEDFRDKEEAWDLRARQRSGAEASTSAFEAAVSIYEKALQTVETEKMFDMYLAFLREQVVLTLKPCCALLRSLPGVV